ncbi:hypothetical protein [Bradyrhizobium sp. USDA 329]|uniref:hypothetical protein n=1 Tax=unclassified Bradyrhizobium TaxID=2631580 RepID=UPI0035126EF5
MIDTKQTVRCTGCGQLNRLWPETVRSGFFKCSKCGKILRSVTSKDGGQNVRPAFALAALVAAILFVVFVGLRLEQQSKSAGSQRAPTVSTATAKHSSTYPVREIEHSIPPPVLPAGVPVPSPLPVRDCRDADVSCILERNEEIMARNKDVMSGGPGQMMPLTKIPILPVPPAQTLVVAKAPRGTDKNQVAVRSASPTTMNLTKPAPPTGDLQTRNRRNAIAPFSVRTKTGSNYLIKLVNVANSKDQIWIFLRGGEPYSTKVPVGAYSLRVASGSTWYGRGELFGPDTRFFRLRGKRGAAVAETPILEFKKERNRIVGHTLSFEGSGDGNMEQEAMTRSEFDAN